MTIGLLLLTLPKSLFMKTLVLLLGLSFALYSCGSGQTGMTKNSGTSEAANDTIRIVNDSLEYEIIIVEPGFESWLVSQPPRGYYSQSFLETKNRMFVSEYNQRVLQPARYPRNLYTEQINYDPAIDYGYEVNYLLYNYFLYFQEKYKQHFIGSRK